MFTVFRQSLARSRGTILGWGLSLALLSMYLMTFYDTLVEQQAGIQQLLAGYPPELMSFFGNVTQMYTPEGYLTLEFFSYMPLVLGIYAVLAGSGLVASEEENGTLDLVLAHPISRSRLFLGRFLAFLGDVFVILAISWVGFVIGMRWTHMELSWGELAIPFIPLAAVLLLFGSLALLGSMLLPARRLAAMLAGLVVVGSFFVTSLARVDENLEAVARFSPLNYYQSGDAILGLNWGWLLGLIGASALLALLAWWLFERRDIRVGGEGNWRLPMPWKKPAPAEK
jgi:ABC-2 type transport system permease protein